MNPNSFRKMKARPGMAARVFQPPACYPQDDTLSWKEDGPADFVHLFVQSRAEFEKLFPQVAAALKEGGLLWLSYPKAAGRQKPDINRDSLWDLVIPHGWHPVAQVALSDAWSAIRLKPNEPGKEYARPVG